MEYGLLFSIALIFALAVLAGRAVDRAIQKAKKQIWIVAEKAPYRYAE